MQKHLTKIREVSWEDVFSDWKEREKGIWDEHFRERGYVSWDAWRSKLVAPIHPERRVWKLYRIEEPEEIIPEMWIGGFKGWRKYLSTGQRCIQFKDLVRSSGIKENKKVLDLLKNFPKETTIIAVRLGEEMVLLEGMHRGTALALAASEGRRIETKLTVALTDFDESERDLFNQCRTQQETGTFLDDLRAVHMK